jgi:hypothetical protein
VAEIRRRHRSNTAQKLNAMPGAGLK